jgi:GT2 family glycosyltransferase
MKIAVLIACHNRRKQTIECLRRLYQQDRLGTATNGVPAVTLVTYLVDDGSTDGTTEAVHEHFPDVQIIRGNGSLFWAGAMRVAWDAAASSGDLDAYFLVNDDTRLEKHALSVLLDTLDYIEQKHGCGGIAVGTVVDERGNFLYGGFSRGLRRVRVLAAAGRPAKCQLFNCNATVISTGAFMKLGAFGQIFTHAMADYEYARRAEIAAVPSYVAPTVVGACNRNPTPEWMSSDTPIWRRFKAVRSPKGLPFREYVVLCRALHPWLWPVLVMSAYRPLLFPRRKEPISVDGFGLPEPVLPDKAQST